MKKISGLIFFLFLFLNNNIVLAEKNMETGKLYVQLKAYDSAIVSYKIVELAPTAMLVLIRKNRNELSCTNLHNLA